MEIVRAYGINTAEMILLYLFVDGSMRFRFLQKFKMVYVGILVLLLPVIDCLGVSDVKMLRTMIMVTVTVCLSLWFYSESVFQKIIYPLFYYIIIIISEFASSFILVLFLQNDWGKIANSDRLYVAGALLSLAIQSIAVFAARYRKQKEKRIDKIYQKEIILCATVIVIYAVFVAGILSNAGWFMQDTTILLIASCLFVFVMLLTMMLLYHKLVRQSEYDYKLKLKLSQIEHENKLNSDMVQIVSRLRSLRHDLNNHLGVVRSLLQTEQYEELEEYLGNIYEDVEAANDFIVVKDKVLTILLNTKKQQAKKQHVDFEVVVSVDGIGMEGSDLTALLSNIIDNAIEAAAKVQGNRYIMLNIKRTMEKIILECENSYTEEPVIVNNKFISTKTEKEEHGIGTENIQEIVRKYGGELYYEIEDVFRIRIEIPLI